LPLPLLSAALAYLQLTFGRVYEGAELQSLHTSYKEWINGLPAWPWLNIPFTPYAAALTARDVMMQHFQVEVAAARAKMEEGAAVGGLLGDMLAAVGENGSRWVFISHKEGCRSRALQDRQHEVGQVGGGGLPG
jgi:hypothetical protein